MGTCGVVITKKNIVSSARNKEPMGDQLVKKEEIKDCHANIRGNSSLKDEWEHFCYARHAYKWTKRVNERMSTIIKQGWRVVDTTRTKDNNVPARGGKAPTKQNQVARWQEYPKCTQYINAQVFSFVLSNTHEKKGQGLSSTLSQRHCWGLANTWHQNQPRTNLSIGVWSPVTTSSTSTPFSPFLQDKQAPKIASPQTYLPFSASSLPSCYP